MRAARTRTWSITKIPGSGIVSRLRRSYHFAAPEPKGHWQLIGASNAVAVDSICQTLLRGITEAHETRAEKILDKSKTAQAP